MSDTDPLHEWLTCPECGHNDFGHIPTPARGRNAYLMCPECGAEAVLAG